MALLTPSPDATVQSPARGGLVRPGLRCRAWLGFALAAAGAAVFAETDSSATIDSAVADQAGGDRAIDHGVDAAVVAGVDRVTVEQLRAELAQRDAVIIDLLNRVRALEAGRASSSPGAAAAAALTAPSDSRAGAPDRDEATATPNVAGAGPGSGFDIDAALAERALERGLVQEGARLLAPGQIELAPSVAVSRQDGMFPVALMRGDATLVGEIEQTYDVVETRADLRIGLPWNAQLELGLPYVSVDHQIATGIDGSVEMATERSGAGFGDATVGFAKVLATEDAWRPQLVGRLVWLTGSGDERDGAVTLAGGYPGFATRLDAYWRRDPVVFLLGGGYTQYRHGADVTPGDTLDLSLGVGLALSPETAMVFSVRQAFADEFQRDGVALPGTDRLASTLDLAVSTILGRRLFLRGYTAAGLTEDSPDYRFELSLTSRFDAR